MGGSMRSTSATKSDAKYELRCLPLPERFRCSCRIPHPLYLKVGIHHTSSSKRSQDLGELQCSTGRDVHDGSSCDRIPPLEVLLALTNSS